MRSPIEEGVAFVRPGFLAGGDELFARLAARVVWDDRIRARRVASFGVPYNYSGTVWPEAPVPDVLVPVAAAVAGAVGYEPNNCLANYYPTGDATMGYHADSVAGLEPGTGISIVSLGAARAISFRRQTDRTEVHELVLGGGSLLHMTAARAGRTSGTCCCGGSVASGSRPSNGTPPRAPRQTGRRRPKPRLRRGGRAVRGRPRHGPKTSGRPRSRRPRSGRRMRPTTRCSPAFKSVTRTTTG